MRGSSFTSSFRDTKFHVDQVACDLVIDIPAKRSRQAIAHSSFYDILAESGSWLRGTLARRSILGS